MAPIRKTRSIETSPSDNIVQCGMVSHAYHDKPVLRDLSFSLQRGQMVGLLGPNGAGKTTLLRILIGLTRPSAGFVRICGMDPRLRATHAHFGAILQRPSLPEHLRVRELVALYASFYSRSIPLREAIDFAELTAEENKTIASLSIGMRQRVQMALAVVGDPQILFLDEPASSLDVETRMNFLARLARLTERGKTVLLSTHILSDIDEVCQRILVLNEGKNVFDGTPVELKMSSRSALITCRTQLSDEAILALAPRLHLVRRNSHVEILCAEPENLLRALLAQDPSLSRLQVLNGSLEDAFRDFIQNDRARIVQEDPLHAAK